jgi:hypothetical protein
MGHLLARDTINGAEGAAFITIDGKNKPLVGLRNIRAGAEIQSNPMRVVRTRKTQNKNSGVTMSGTGNVYYGTPLFTQILLKYIEEGISTPFSIQIINDDPAVSVGTQNMIFYDCELTGEIPLAILDDEQAMLAFDFNFSIGDVDMMSSFTEPAQLGD